MRFRFSVFLSMILIVLALLSGCASSGTKGSVLAIVDGKPITEGDLGYSLEIAHRREDLKGAGALDLSEYLDQLIKRSLIIEEAYRMGLDREPAIQEKVKDFVLRESVSGLRNDEILRKISVSDGELKETFNRDYEQFHLQLIETDSREKAESVLKRLGEKAEFGDLAKELSTHKSAKDEGKVTYIGRALESSPLFRDAVAQLKPGGVSGIIEIQGKYYVIKLVSREKAAEDQFGKIKGSLTAQLRKQKDKERGDEYLLQLRKKADIEINKELLSEIKLDAGDEELKKYREDKRTLARVFDETITVAEFMASIAADGSSGHSSGKKTARELLDNWIDFKVVDHEALRRNYKDDPAVRDRTERYMNELLLRAYVDKVIMPEVKFTEEALQKYYDENKEKFSTPAMYKIRELSFDDRDKALDALKKIRSGADFSWVADQEAPVKEGEEQAGTGWIAIDSLPAKVGEIVDALGKGDVSDIIQTGDAGFSIIKVLDKKEKAPIDLEKIKQRVYEDWYSARIRELVKEYGEKLASTANIEIRQDALKKLRDRFEKTKPQKKK